ncbi:mitochondrial inner membrane protease ATP23 [Rhodotorula diobovata]|uniref:Mitochondrial inner membrane protease ATP23 n=1 Tax=Rhodotorula diobovata TaxID=5288 RepID=A0A5C5FNI9_9BASI|nr:mitochondrial inner membrane protease ATP23 [Rhodotorula diobovata]
MTRPPQQPAFSQDDSPSFRASFEQWRRSLTSFAARPPLRCEPQWSDGPIMHDDKNTPNDPARDPKREAADCRRCEKWRDELARESPIVRFLLTHISLLPPSPNSPMPTPEHSPTPHLPIPITCSPCPPTMAGGFSPELGILLCQNRFMSRKHMEDALAHELVHAWDERRFTPKGKWGDDLRAHACTEIRAETLSGDCRFGREFTRRNWHFAAQHQACVRRRAILSVAANPNCASRQEAERVVNEVFESCWPDTRPFDEIY